MRSRGIVGNCVYMYSCTIVLFSVMFKDLLHFLNWSNPPRQSPLVGWLYIIFTIILLYEKLLQFD